MNTSTHEHTMILPWVQSATNMFVNAKEMREAFSLAIVSGLNLIFSGPGGHGKSEFLNAAFGAIETATYVKSFGQGTSSEELYGGLDLEALNRQGGTEKAAIQFNPELSFLAHNVAVFEELFDAPSRVLTSLKDTMTARELRNRHQRFPMKTRVIAGATNHSPQDIAEGGPEIAALVERFPIQLEVRWADYSESSFMELFETVGRDEPAPQRQAWNDIAALQEKARAVECSVVIQRILAKIIVEIRKDKVIISPRTAVLSLQLAKAAAAINDRSEVAIDDLVAIAFLPGAHSLRQRIVDLIGEYQYTVEQEIKLENASKTLEKALLTSPSSETDFEAHVLLLEDLHNTVEYIHAGDSHWHTRQRLLEEIVESKRTAQQQLHALRTSGTVASQEATLERIARDIKSLTGEYRNSSGDARRSARIALVGILEKLFQMNVHPSLQGQQDNLIAKIELFIS